jgi:hypothetical protein
MSLKGSGMFSLPELVMPGYIAFAWPNLTEPARLSGQRLNAMR